MAAAVDERRKPDARFPPNVQGSDSFGSVNLVCADGNQIRATRGYIERNFSQALDSIAVKQDVALAAKGTDSLDRLKHTGLVVGKHDTHQQSALIDCLP